MDKQDCLEHKSSEMEIFSSVVEGAADMQIDVMEEGEHQPPLIDFFARDNEVTMVTDDMPDQSADIGYTAGENQLNAVTATDQHAEQSFIDFIPLDYPRAQRSNFLYYDFFNGGILLNNYAPENQPSDGVDVAEQSVQDINQLSDAENVDEQSALNMGYTAIANQLNAAADRLENIDYILEFELSDEETDVDEQSVQEIYIVLENLPSAADNVVQQSPQQIVYIVLENLQIAAHYVIEVQNTDAIQESSQGIGYYNALVNQLRAAAYVYDHALLENDYTALENHEIIQQSGLNIRVMGDNEEMASDGLVVRLTYTPDEDADEQPFVVRPASRSVVRNLESVTFTEESVERDSVVCAVCQNDFNVGETAKKLPCPHYYHEDCILPWLELRNTCPACRYELPIDNDSDDEHEENERASPEQGQT